MTTASLKSGQTLYDVHRERTAMKQMGVWLVRIGQVNDDGTFMASWNGNPVKKYWAVPRSWKAKKPYVVRSEVTGGQRLATLSERNHPAAQITEQQCMYVVRVPR